MDKEIVKMYSENDNIDICMEECGELIHALSKYKRSKGYGYLTKTTQKEAYTNLVQAVADAINAIESVSYKMGLNKYDIGFEIAKADAKARRNLYGETEEENEDTLASVKRYWFKKALKKDEEKQEEIAKNEFHSEKYTMKSEKHPEKQAKNEFHSEKCSIKNNNVYPETYWIDKNNHDAVNHPSHYCTGGIECIDVIKATSQGMDGIEAFCHGNAMKYLFRWKQKNGMEDLKKARWYIDKLIEIQENSVNKNKE